MTGAAGGLSYVLVWMEGGKRDDAEETFYHSLLPNRPKKY